MAITVSITAHTPLLDEPDDIAERFIHNVVFLAVEADAVQIVTNVGQHETLPVGPHQSVAVKLVIA